LVNIQPLSLQTGGDQGPVEQGSGRTYEGLALLIFPITGLLAHHHDGGRFSPWPNTVWVASR
jgi:hypothetical protein